MGFNHDAFLDDAFLGSDATLNGSGIRVCLSLDPEEITLGGDITPQAIAGKAGCKTSDVAGVKRSDVLIVNEVSYRVLKVQSDETGWTTLVLGKSY